jgi:nucleoside-diphosphate-sugar epimerase
MAAAHGSHGLSVFNVGTGTAHSVKDVVNLLERILGRAIRVVEEPSRVRTSERMLLVADIEKIRLTLGWVPRISLQDSLMDLVASYGLHAD